MSRVHHALHRNRVTALVTKVVVTVVGTLVVVAGCVMLVTPGPAFVIIPLGLAILATEYRWAERLLQKAKEKASQAAEKARNTDPRTRRRHLLVTGVAVLVVFGAVAAYVVLYDWPRIAVNGWDAVQRIAGWVPELPGM